MAGKLSNFLETDFDGVSYPLVGC